MKDQNHSEKDTNNSANMKDKVKYLEKTVATLTISLYTLQGQLFDLKKEVGESTEINDKSISDSDVSDENEQNMAESNVSEESEIEKLQKEIMNSDMKI